MRDDERPVEHARDGSRVAQAHVPLAQPAGTRRGSLTRQRWRVGSTAVCPALVGLPGWRGAWRGGWRV
eukprot:3910040-Pleurochrysis_carterae.AAC.3